jgi:energy-coupling factor transporter ATP-binding protein EcfA2
MSAPTQEETLTVLERAGIKEEKPPRLTLQDAIEEIRTHVNYVVQGLREQLLTSTLHDGALLNCIAKRLNITKEEFQEAVEELYTKYTGEALPTEAEPTTVAAEAAIEGDK